MTEEEILKIKEHIEIHARREPRAVYITQIMWKVVEELEHIAELEQENAELKHNKKTVAHLADCLEEKMKERIEELEKQIEKMKQCGNCGNNTIGNCEYCKRKPNQIFSDTLTSDYWRLKEIKRK